MLKPTSTDESIATATLDNSKKTITITAASGITETKTAEITVTLNEDSSKSVTIKVTVSPDSENQGDTMTLTFTLSNNVDASKIKIHYYNADINDDELTDSIGKTETKTFENKSASFTILSSQASSWGCNALVYIYDSSDSDITSTLDKISVSGGSGGGTGTSTFDGADVRKVWFAYAKDSTVTVALDKDTETYTQLVDPISVTDASTLYQIVEASKFQEANPSKVKIELSDITYTDESSTWITLTAENGWTNQIDKMQSTKTKTLDYSSDKAFMAGLLSNGLYIGAASGVTCTVKVSYIAGESKTPGSFTVTAGTATTETIPLTWTASENAQYYTVQYKTSDATDYTTAGTATETSYTVSGLAANTTYTILVTAYNGANGTAAEAVSATTAEDTKTYTFPYETSYTADGSLIKILPASAFTDKTVNQLTITVSSVSYTGTDSVWLTAAGDTDWKQQASLSASGDDYTVTVTTSDFITAVKTNGLYLAGISGLTGTVTVSYSEEEVKTVTYTQLGESVVVTCAENNGWWNLNTSFSDIENISAIKITAIPTSDDTTSGGWMCYANATEYKGNFTPGNDGFEAIITDSSVISSIAGDGGTINVYGTSGLKVTVSVYYATSSTTE